jgi:hypothetical protein
VPVTFIAAAAWRAERAAERRRHGVTRWGAVARRLNDEGVTSRAINRQRHQAIVLLEAKFGDAIAGCFGNSPARWGCSRWPSRWLPRCSAWRSGAGSHARWPP